MGKKSKVIISIFFIAVILNTAILMYFFNKNASSQIRVFYQSESSFNLESREEPYDTISVFSNTEEAARYYRYTVPADSDNNSYVNMEYDGAWNANLIGDSYMITTLKNDRLHSFKLDNHVLDQLLYLNNDTECAEVLFETYGKNRILYGNSSIVIIYNCEKDAVQYISLTDKSIVKEQELKLEKKYYTYSFYVDLKDATIDIDAVSIWENFDFSGSNSSSESFFIPLLK